MQSTVFTHFRKTIKLIDHLDKNEEDNTGALSDYDYLCNDMAEENNELNYCFEEINSLDQAVEPEDDRMDQRIQDQRKKSNGHQQQLIEKYRLRSRTKTQKTWTHSLQRVKKKYVQLHLSTRELDVLTETWTIYEVNSSVHIL